MRPIAAAVAFALACASPVEAQDSTPGPLTVDGITLHHRVVGTGTDTVIVPMGSALGDRLEPLAASRTLVFYDMRGRGRSDAVTDPGRLGFDEDVRDLEAVRRHVGAGRVSVIGYSYLGAVAARWAMRYPEHVDRLALLAPMPPRAPHPDALGADDVVRLLGPEAAGRLQTTPEALPATTPGCREWWRAVAPLYVGSATDAATLLPDLDLGCDLPNERPRSFMATLGAVLGGLGTYDWRAAVRSIHRPVLVLHGADDRAAPPAGGREWAEAVDDGHLETVEGAGHFVLFERPLTVLRLLDGFLPGSRRPPEPGLTPAP